LISAVILNQLNRSSLI